jgi:hypothetical protein
MGFVVGSCCHALTVLRSTEWKGVKRKGKQGVIYHDQITKLSIVFSKGSIQNCKRYFSCFNPNFENKMGQKTTHRIIESIEPLLNFKKAGRVHHRKMYLYVPSKKWNGRVS